MKRNPGYLPAEAEGKRIDGVLVNGRPFTNWAADGRGSCDWKRTGSGFDIDWYEVRA